MSQKLILDNLYNFLLIFVDNYYSYCKYVCMYQKYQIRPADGEYKWHSYIIHTFHLSDISSHLLQKLISPSLSRNPADGVIEKEKSSEPLHWTEQTRDRKRETRSLRQTKEERGERESSVLPVSSATYLPFLYSSPSLHLLLHIFSTRSLFCLWAKFFIVSLSPDVHLVTTFSLLLPPFTTNTTTLGYYYHAYSLHSVHPAAGAAVPVPHTHHLILSRNIWPFKATATFFHYNCGPLNQSSPIIAVLIQDRDHPDKYINIP